MVRVLTCHHFAYQEVFTTDYEPQTLCAADEKIFVSTSQCYIEVHMLTKHGCPLITKFPTVGTVLQLAYCKTDNFVATLEDKNHVKSSSQRAVRVYLNWPPDGSSTQPMRARIAGYMTSLRHAEKDSEDKRFEVVEIPLKEEPNCIAVDEKTGILAIGVGCTVLMYGFCSKEVADSCWRYEDMKMLLELKFSFSIRQVAVCEEYIATASDSHLQVVKLQTSSKCQGTSCRMGVTATTCSQDRHVPASITTAAAAAESATDVASKDADQHAENSPDSDLSQDSDSEDEMPIKKDKHLIHWTFSDSEGEDDSHRDKKKHRHKHGGFFSRGASKKHEMPTRITKKSIILRGLQGAVRTPRKKMEDQLKNTGEILGPLNNPPDCHVTIEYEDTCDVGSSLKYLSNSVTTYIYRKLDNSENRKLHSLQLLPVYYPSDESKKPVGSESPSQEQQQSTSSCCSGDNSQHRPLLGMYCFISSPTEGLMYKVVKSPKMLMTLAYSSPAIEVCHNAGLLYAITQTGVEVYTSRCLTSSLFDLKHYDGITSTLPPDSMEVCLIGMQPFIGAQTAAFTSDFLVLCSKHVYEDYGMSEVNWSIYALKTPKIPILYRDMKEMIDQYHKTAVPSSDIAYLLKEAHVALEGSTLLEHVCDDPEIAQCRTEAFYLLAEYLARPGSEDWHLTLPYFLMSGMTLSQFLNVIQDTAEKSQDEENLIVCIYSEADGNQLSRVLSLSQLHGYDIGHALERLKSWMTSYKNAPGQVSTGTLDSLVLTAMYLHLGSHKDAEETLHEMHKRDIIHTCTRHSRLLHNNFCALRPLGLFLWQQEPKVFLRIITRWLHNTDVTLENLLQLADSFEEQKSVAKTKMLENILYDQRCKTREEAALELACLYLDSMDNAADISSADDQASGLRHLADRYQWLQELDRQSHLSDCSTRVNLELLLCSPLCTEKLVKLVHHRVSQDPSHNAIHILCLSKLEPNKAVEQIVQHCPQLTTLYVKEMATEDNKLLGYAIKHLTEKLKSEESAELMAVYKEVLSYAAEVQTKEELLGILPPDGNSEFFLPYLQKCYHVNQAKLLKETIMKDAKMLATFR